MTIAEQKAARLQVQETAKALLAKADAEGRAMTPEEQKLCDEKLKEGHRLSADIDRREQLERLEGDVNRIAPRVSEPQQPAQYQPVQAAIPHVANLRAFKTRHGETSRDACRRAYDAGMWLRAILFHDETGMLYCREHGIGLRSQKEGVNSQGGALVPNELAAAVIDLRAEYGVFARYAKVQPMNRDTLTIARRVSGLTMYALGEGTEITESSKAWNQVELTARKWGAMAKISSELNEDATISLADDLAGEIAYADALKQDQCGFDGSGAATYHGIVGIRPKLIDGNHAGSYVTAATADVWSEVTDADLTAVIGKTPGYAITRQPRWYAPRGACHNIFGRLIRASGGVTAAEMSAGYPLRYAGYEVVPVDAWTDTSTTDNTGKVTVLFGALDLAATVGDRRQIGVKVSSERFIETDMIAVVGISRWDIVVHDIGSSSAAGPMVALVGA